MSVPVWCADLAAGFWAAAGTPPPFPRDLRDVIPGALPLNVVMLPGVSVSAVRGWLSRRGVSVPLNEPDRPLRACLVARLGRGFAFIDSLGSLAERSFSLAHELAHFLRDYLHPRETATRRLGPAAAEVLDGKRVPTPVERFQAVLRNAPVGPFTHLLRRDATGAPLNDAEREAESAADRLAFELLAPAGDVGEPADRTELVRRLTDVFRLPPEPAERYAALLVPDSPKPGALVTRFLIC